MPKMTKHLKRPVVAFFESIRTKEAYFSQNIPDADCRFVAGNLTQKNALRAKDAQGISVFVGSKVTRQVLDMLPNLKFIATRSTGFDHIDLEACARRGILVSNVPSYGESTVAEHTFALLLTISRKINRIYERTARADFSLSGMQGFDLEGKTIGVVGVGKIGSHVIRIARGFGMNVIAYEPHPKPQLASSLGFCYASFEELLALSDIITLHAPYNKSTYHLINSKNIGRLKKGVVLINTSRGELIETGALVRGLKKGLVGGAGLDVLEGEGLIKEEGQLLSKDYSQEALKTIIQNHVLLKFENVVITPHCAFYSHEAVRRIEDTTIENIKAFLRGGQANAVALGQ